MLERYFTPVEVNLAIPELERIIGYLRNLHGDIHDKEWRLSKAKAEANRFGQAVNEATFLSEEAEIDFLRILAQGQFERVHELGGEIKGGYMVDFPGSIGGNAVLLCWKPGEASVTWYHGLQEGMLGRKRIPDELLGAGEPDEFAE